MCLRVRGFTHLRSIYLERAEGRPAGEEVNSDLKELMSDPKGHEGCLTTPQKLIGLQRENVFPCNLSRGSALL